MYLDNDWAVDNMDPDLVRQHGRPLHSTTYYKESISRPESPNNNSQSEVSMTNNSHHHCISGRSSLILVDGIGLITYLDDGCKYSRPLYLSPSISNDQSLASHRKEDVLHLFSNTRISFEVLLRLLDTTNGPVKVLIHMATFSDGQITDLLVANSEDISIINSDTSQGLLIELPKFPIKASYSGTHRRLQVFDQERRLIFTKQWEVQVGILNDDAISWIRESEHAFPAKEASLEFVPQIAPNKRDSSIPNDRQYSFHSQAASTSASFVSLDEDFPDTPSRTDSMITTPVSSPSEGLESSQTVDFLQQLGFWIYGTRVGQIISNYDPKENVKSLYSMSPLWLLGRLYRNDYCLGNDGGPAKAIKVDRISALRRRATPLWYQLFAIPLSDDSEDKMFELNEILRISCHNIVRIKDITTFITSNDGLILGNVADFELAFSAIGATFRLKYEKDEEFTILSIYAQAQPESSGETNDMMIRSFAVDLVSKVLGVVACESVEFLGLNVRNCRIDIGPHPHGLVPVTGAIQGNEQVPGVLSMQVLLWSEHVHDWIFRKIRIFRQSRLMEIHSPFHGIEPLSLNILSFQVFLFADASWRFSFSKKGTWLCFRCSSEEDFKRVAGLLPFFLKPTLPSSPILSPLSSPKTITPIVNYDVRTPPGLETFLLDFESLFWFTYRKDFPRLGPSILSSDAGFGCMIRAGQSMMAEALARLWLDGTRRHWQQISENLDLRARYESIIQLFLDNPTAESPLSIHNLVQMGAQLGTPIGEYFNPTTIARALRRQCRQVPGNPLNMTLVKEGIFRARELAQLAEDKPLVVLIVLRLGADFLNHAYAPLLWDSLSCPLTLGILGGRSSRAFYIVGFQDDCLIYLDPHALRPTVADARKALDCREYHTRIVCEMAVTALDPTVLLGFLCKSAKDVFALQTMLKSVVLPMPLFSFV